MDFIQHTLARVAGPLEWLVSTVAITLIGALGLYLTVKFGTRLVRRWLYRKAVRMAAVPGTLVDSALSAAVKASSHTSAFVAEHYSIAAANVGPVASTAVAHISSAASRVGTAAGDAVEAATPVARSLVSMASTTAGTATVLAREGIEQAKPVIRSAASSLHSGATELAGRAVAVAPVAITALAAAQTATSDAASNVRAWVQSATAPTDQKPGAVIPVSEPTVHREP
jgi:hypothetical protein